MAQPAVSVGEDRTDLIGVPAFWPKPTREPLFTWESWIGHFFLREHCSTNLREHCNANILLSDPVEVFDDPPLRSERKGESENQTEEANSIARDQAESAKQTKTTRKEGKRDQKSGHTYSSIKRIKGTNRGYSFLWDQRVRKFLTKPRSHRHRNDEFPRFLQSLRGTF